jgi:hypothetical protein
MIRNLPTRLDQGLEGPTPTLVRNARSLLEGKTMPCGYPGCTYCDPDVVVSTRHGHRGLFDRNCDQCIEDGS